MSRAVASWTVNLSCSPHAEIYPWSILIWTNFYHFSQEEFLLTRLLSSSGDAAGNIHSSSTLIRLLYLENPGETFFTWRFSLLILLSFSLSLASLFNLLTVCLASFNSSTVDACVFRCCLSQPQNIFFMIWLDLPFLFEWIDEEICVRLKRFFLGNTSQKRMMTLKRQDQKS